MKLTVSRHVQIWEEVSSIDQASHHVLLMSVLPEITIFERGLFKIKMANAACRLVASF